MFHSVMVRFRACKRLHFSLQTSGAAMLIILCATMASAQIGGIDSDPGDPGTGGKHMIQGMIFYENGRRLDRRAKVRLRSLSMENFVMSDDTGSFSFRRLRDGSYTVIVDAGNDYEIATENVDIIEPARRPSDPGQSRSVQIILRAKKSIAKPVGTVDASTGGVPEEARQLYKQALDLVQAGEHKKAIEQLNEALKLYPTFVPALNELGVQYMRQKEYGKAEVSLREAVRLAPDAFTPQLNFGILMLQKKDFVSAATALERAVQKDSSSSAAHFQLGKVFVNMGVYNKAEKELLQTIGIGGENIIEAHRYLGVVYIETRNNTRAVEQLEQYLSLAPKAKDADKIRGIVKDLRAQK